MFFEVMRMYVQLAYYSTAARKYDFQDLLGIIEVSCHNNATCGVTGILLYGERMFLQSQGLGVTSRSLSNPC